MLTRKWLKQNSDKIFFIVGGYISNEVLLSFIFKGLQTKPDIIIYTGNNDVHTRLVELNDYQPDASGFRRVWNDRNSKFYKKTTLYKLWIGYNTMQSVDSFVSTKKDEELFVPYCQQNAELWEQRLEVNKPVYFEQNVRNITAVAKANNIKVVLITFAQNHGFEGDTNNQTWFAKAVNEHNTVIEKISVDTKTLLFKLGENLLFTANNTLWVDRRHNNELWAIKKAELIADFIQDRKLLLMNK